MPITYLQLKIAFNFSLVSPWKSIKHATLLSSFPPEPIAFKGMTKFPLKIQNVCFIFPACFWTLPSVNVGFFLCDQSIFFIQRYVFVSTMCCFYSKANKTSKFIGVLWLQKSKNLPCIPITGTFLGTQEPLNPTTFPVFQSEALGSKFSFSAIVPGTQKSTNGPVGQRLELTSSCLVKHVSCKRQRNKSQQQNWEGKGPF